LKLSYDYGMPRLLFDALLENIVLWLENDLFFHMIKFPVKVKLFQLPA